MNSMRSALQLAVSFLLVSVVYRSGWRRKRACSHSVKSLLWCRKAKAAGVGLLTSLVWDSVFGLQGWWMIADCLSVGVLCRVSGLQSRGGGCLLLCY